jgi:hypothetical protein
MEILGYVLIAAGAIGLFGNISGRAHPENPDPFGASKRAGCFIILIAAGGILIWIASS